MPTRRDNSEERLARLQLLMKQYRVKAKETVATVKARGAATANRVKERLIRSKSR